jgi:hypothetical protein
VQALNGRAVATDRVVDVPSTDEVHGTKVR